MSELCILLLLFFFHQKSTEDCSINKRRADIADKSTGDDGQDKAGDDYNDDDDEEERFVDLPLPAEFQDEDADGRAQTMTTDTGCLTEENVGSEEAEVDNRAKSQKGVSSWVHRQNLKGGFTAQKHN